MANLSLEHRVKRRVVVQRMGPCTRIVESLHQRTEGLLGWLQPQRLVSHHHRHLPVTIHRVKPCDVGERVHLRGLQADCRLVEGQGMVLREVNTAEQNLRVRGNRWPHTSIWPRVALLARFDQVCALQRPCLSPLT